MTTAKVFLATARFNVLPNRKRVIPAGEQLLALKVIQQALAEKGIDETTLLPLKQIEANRIDAVVEQIANNIDTQKQTMIGISTDSVSYSVFLLMANALRQAFPQALIFAGGPFFPKREGLVLEDKIFMDSTELVLRKKTPNGRPLFDGVNVGGCSSFAEYITSGQFDLSQHQLPGLYYLDRLGNVCGFGTGKPPQLNSLPYVFGPERLRRGKTLLEIVLEDNCPHRCDFCSIDFSGGFGLTREKRINDLKELFNRLRPDRLNLIDSNPFVSATRHFYLQALGIDEGRATLKAVYLNPAYLTEPSFFDYLQLLINDCNVRGFYIGRDVITAVDAAILGSRLNKKIKSQVQLDAELAGIKEFIAFLKGYPRMSFEVIVSYVLNPFATFGDDQAVRREINSLVEMSCDSVEVLANYGELAPYVGAPIRQKFLSLLVDPEDFVGPFHWYKI